MGKKQHNNDRMFLTAAEWATEWGGAKSKENSMPFKHLPYYCCLLTFTPFDVPVCTANDNVFDLMNILPYIKKYGKHPVTRAPLTDDDLIHLPFHKNSDVVMELYLFAVFGKPRFNPILNFQKMSYCQ